MKKENCKQMAWKKNGWMDVESRDLKKAKKKIKESLTKKSWGYYNQIKEQIENKIEKPFPLNGKVEPIIDKQIEEEILKHKNDDPNDLCQFSLGYPDYYDKELEYGPFSLSKFEKCTAKN